MSSPKSEGAPGPLSARYPGGFAAVPLALLRHPGHRPLHVAVYVAVASVVDHRTGRTGEGDRAAHRERLLERAGLKDPHAIARALSDLERWGFLKVSRLRGAPAIYETLPTAPELVRSTSTRVVRSTRTGVVRSTRTGVVRSTRTVPQKGSEGSEIAGGTPQRTPTGTPQVVRSNDTTTGAPPPDLSEQMVASLRRAVGADAAEDAIAEVRFRLAHPEVDGRVVERPARLARLIGDCYRGRCRNPDHGPLHGAAARDYHRGRRADFEQKDRAEGRRRRASTDNAEEDLASLAGNEIARLTAWAVETPAAVRGLTPPPAITPAEVTP